MSAHIADGDPGDDAAQIALEWVPLLNVDRTWAQHIADGLKSGALQAVSEWQDGRMLSITIQRVNTDD